MKAAGIFEVITGCLLLLFGFIVSLFSVIAESASESLQLLTWGLPILALGIVAVIGGVYALIKRDRAWVLVGFINIIIAGSYFCYLYINPKIFLIR